MEEEWSRSLKFLVPQDEDLLVNYPVSASGLDPIYCEKHIEHESLKFLVPKDEVLCDNFPVFASGLDPIKSKDVIVPVLNLDGIVPVPPLNLEGIAPVPRVCFLPQEEIEESKEDPPVVIHYDYMHGRFVLPPLITDHPKVDHTPIAPPISSVINIKSEFKTEATDDYVNKIEVDCKSIIAPLSNTLLNKKIKSVTDKIVHITVKAKSLPSIVPPRTGSSMVDCQRNASLPQLRPRVNRSSSKEAAEIKEGPGGFIVLPLNNVKIGKSKSSSFMDTGKKKEGTPPDLVKQLSMRVRKSKDICLSSKSLDHEEPVPVLAKQVSMRVRKSSDICTSTKRPSLTNEVV
eukprot:CAMPEP_0119034270 /NCGR_PEP_ID=MMETSP1177-20130426/1274_1 /TAXON_ID=2985 /ORGANISM="Ochromonas sp, Strain CCMP1899" /LENGTH=344 /DNA_ID=CAMNT_0006991593 /DNA_START=246 /DNA_END=1280 /DNA_ORIENTATION=+